MLPLVSCLCPTFGRFPEFGHLLCETVESFLRQTYPRKELLILNDCAGQTLACNAPGVRVVNVGRRFASLGEKYNAAVRLSAGDLLCTWEDDDISLPWRIEQGVRRIGGAAYWNPQRSWFLDEGGANPEGVGLHRHHSHGVCHNASIFARSAWEKAGGYPAMSGAQDAAMDRRLKALGPCPPPLGDDWREWSYVYRWGVSPIHLSGQPDPDTFYRGLDGQGVRQGRFEIVPGWRADYVAMRR